MRMNAVEQKVCTLLLVESNGSDVELFLRTLEQDLPRYEDEQVEIVINATAEGALRRLREQPIHLVITGLRLPDMTGIQLMDRIHDAEHRIPVLVTGCMDTLDGIVEAMRHGAFDYLVKPYERVTAVPRIHRAMRMSEILLSSVPIPQPRQPQPFNDIVCVSPAMRTVTGLIDAVAKVSATALIVGETGTGKELIAKAIHERSDERTGPFQVIDCTMFAEGTVESELFGHVRGAFTGAIADKRGLIESGSQGTVFLDEIGDIPLALQAKLLRVLEEGEVRAVGSTHPKKVHTRFIAATNQDLAEKVQKGEFRKDLYYRLNVMVIRVPALRDRKEDIPVLARYFINKYANDFGKPVPELHPSAVTELIAHPWPGNVRELRNVIERAVMLSQGHQHIDAQVIVSILQGVTKDPWVSGEYLLLPYSQAKEKILEEFNRRYISFKLANNQGNVTRAAVEAGLPRPYFHEIMRRYRRAA
ncbi:Sigma54 dependent transcriptional regulator [Nitrospira moscoviensis]|uniref:Sigma54 dependent transcriptional regulator n=1 Tax=Nitrospira moscoviensis TaxID=42253 RepID=A0A0K2GJ02_NITMO|nr:Sigma54 dependent transcriptional regulator [Nitrospira moscoviensis]